MNRDEVFALIADESHAAEILIRVREKQYDAARETFKADNPRALVRLLDASFKLIDAYRKAREHAAR